MVIIQGWGNAYYSTQATVSHGQLISTMHYPIFHSLADAESAISSRIWGYIAAHQDFQDFRCRFGAGAFGAAPLLGVGGGSLTAFALATGLAFAALLGAVDAPDFAFGVSFGMTVLQVSWSNNVLTDLCFSIMGWFANMITRLQDRYIYLEYMQPSKIL